MLKYWCINFVVHVDASRRKISKIGGFSLGCVNNLVSPVLERLEWNNDNSGGEIINIQQIGTTSDKWCNTEWKVQVTQNCSYFCQICKKHAKQHDEVVITCLTTRKSCVWIPKWTWSLHALPVANVTAIACDGPRLPHCLTTHCSK